ncbi:MAG TPA: DUF3592 domain-containing protein [Verrucomicrobiae bacterium]|nr:DUF3592 domain-containing protein [Verrucomicrobiae bacterium]
MIPDPPRKLSAGAFWSALWDRPRALIFGAWFTIFPIIFLIPFSIAMAAMIPHAPNRTKILAEGVETNAEVTKIETVHNEEINGVNPRKISFRYEINGRTNLASMETLSVEETADWKPGQQIVVRYLGDAATIPSLEPVDFPWILFLLMPLFFGIFGAPFLIYCIIRARNKLKVMKFGIVKKARLLSLAPVTSFGISWFFKTRFEANYVFQNEKSSEVYGSSLTADLVLLNEKKKGDEIEILVLPNQEMKSLILDVPTLKRIQSVV